MDPEDIDLDPQPRQRGGLWRSALGRSGLGRGTRRVPREAWNMRFESIGARIPAAMVVKSPTLLRAAVEEVCWQVAMDSWLATRPRRWRRRAYCAWAAQLKELERRREQLRQLVEAEVLAC
jgi:hypothetical protein